ncbi:MAG: hypothetical protein ACI4EF_08255, partial [Coprococcus sp.]
QFPSYLEKNGTLNIDLILRDGVAMANKEIARINRTMDKLKNMSNHLEESEQLPETDSYYTHEFPERFLLLEPLKDLYPTQKQYISSMTELYFRMEEGSYISLYKQGLLYLSKEGNTQAFAYSEIEKPNDDELAFVLPSGIYKCKCLRSSANSWLKGIPTLIEENNANKYILLQERYGCHLSNEPFWEICISTFSRTARNE